MLNVYPLSVKLDHSERTHLLIYDNWSTSVKIVNKITFVITCNLNFDFEQKMNYQELQPKWYVINLQYSFHWIFVQIEYSFFIWFIFSF